MKKITLLKSGFRLFVVTLCLCSTVFLQSCKDATLEPEKVETTQENSVIVKDGRLIFSSETSMDNYLKDLEKNKSARKGQNYAINLKGFKSMREKYDELVKYDIGKAITDKSIENYKDVLDITVDEQGKKDFDIAIRHILLSSIINENGMIQVGKQVYRIKNNLVYKSLEENIAELKGENLKKTANVSVEQLLVPFEGNKNSRVYDTVDETFLTPYQNNGYRFKTFMQIYRILVGYRAYTCFEVTHKRNVWWGWQSIDASEWTFTSEGRGVTQVSDGQYAFGNREFYLYPNTQYGTSSNLVRSDQTDVRYFNNDQPIRTSVRLTGSWSARGVNGTLYTFPSTSRTGSWDW